MLSIQLIIGSKNLIARGKKSLIILMNQNTHTYIYLRNFSKIL